jgi:F5/8 type C domain
MSMTLARSFVLAAATVAVVSPAVARETSTTALAGGASFKAGLVTLCSTDTFVRVGALNESPNEVTISLDETNEAGTTVKVLSPNASDELRALFPITIPASSKYQVIWDLPVPATQDGVARTGGDRFLHGSWGGGPWLDDNGLTYVSTGGTAGRNGQTCTVPTTPPTTTKKPPSTEAAPVKAVAVYSTLNSQLAARAVDADPATAFVTQMAEWALPTFAWWTADLGRQVPLRTIAWSLTRRVDGHRITVQTSTDGRSWTSLGTLTDRDSGSLTTDVTARLVRFSFRDATPTDQLGYLGDVRFTAAAGYVPAAGGAPNPSVAALRERIQLSIKPASEPDLRSGRYRAKGSARSSNAPDQSSRLALDGKSSTAWRTAMTVAPRSGWVMFDLGRAVSLGELRWKFSELGYADGLRIESSDDGTSWSTVASPGNATAAGEWQRLDVEVTARLVRFFFTNPNSDADVGFLSEVRFYAPES